MNTKNNQIMKTIPVKNIFIFAILVVYSWYTILFSTWSIGEYLLTVLPIVSLILALHNSFYRTTQYIKNILLFLFLYIFMSYLSIFITTKYADITYLNDKIPYIILAILLPVGFYKVQNFNFKFFKYSLTSLLLSMSIFIYLLNTHLVVIDQLKLFYLTMSWNNWTQKNYMFWYILLTFGTVSFYNVKEKKELIWIVGILLLAAVTLSGGYSGSAKFSFAMGVVVYILFSVFTISKKYLLILIWGFTFYIIFAPIILSYLPWDKVADLITGRNYIYAAALSFIKEHWLFGYGYGCTLTLNINDIMEVSKKAFLNHHYGGKFPGGHPHNVALLFWLEFGIVGAFFLAFFIHKLLQYIVEHTYGYINQAAVFSILVSFEIVTSFSWSIWYPQVLLTFAFFGTILTLSMNIKIKK